MVKATSHQKECARRSCAALNIALGQARSMPGTITLENTLLSCQRLFEYQPADLWIVLNMFFQLSPVAQPAQQRLPTAEAGFTRLASLKRSCSCLAFTDSLDIGRWFCLIRIATNIVALHRLSLILPLGCFS